MEHSAAAVSNGVAKKTLVLLVVGVLLAGALQMTLRPGMPVWLAPAGVLFGGVIGIVNFRWLALAVERVYLRQGSTSILSNVAAVVINILKLSLIFIVLYLVITWKIVDILGLIGGLTLCFLAILWQGFVVMTDVSDTKKGPAAS